MPSDDKKSLPPLTDDLVLLDSGLDSLAIAILVARLEETLGFDPFTESDDVAYPVTLGDFIRFYEHAAESHRVDSRQAGCNAPEGRARFLWGATASVCLGDLASGTSLGGRAAELAGRSVLDRHSRSVCRGAGAHRAGRNCPPADRLHTGPAVRASSRRRREGGRGCDRVGSRSRAMTGWAFLCGFSATAPSCPTAAPEFQPCPKPDFQPSGCSSPPARPARRRWSFTASPA